jgi:integrase
MTFKEQADTFLKQSTNRKRNPIRSSTAYTYKMMINKHLVPVLGKKKVEVIDNGAVKSLIASLSEKRLSAATISLVINILKQIIASAVDENGNQMYPRTWNSDFIDLPVVENQRRPIANATAVAGAIKLALEASDTETACLIALLAGTGLRVNEALDISNSRSDVANHFDGCKVLVSRQRGEDSPKTPAGVREVDMHSTLCAFVQKHLFGGGVIFSKSESFYRQALVKYGIIGGFHSLRRFRVTHLRMLGIPEPVVHYWAGHADSTISDRYTMVGEEIQKRKAFAEQAGLGFQLEAS